MRGAKILGLVRRLALGWALPLAVGCQTRESVPGAAPGASAACGTFVSAVCSAAGERSATCADVRSVTEALSTAACQVLGREVDHALHKLAERDQACDRLKHRLCAEFGRSSGVCRMAEQEIGRYTADRCAAMLGRYPEVAAEGRRIADGHEAFLAAHRAPLPDDVPGFGPADARVTLVEFTDFEGADCARGSPVARHVQHQYGGTVRFVFRQFPLAEHPAARLAAEASLAAHAQGKFWEYHDVLFSNQHDLSRPALERYAQAAGLRLAEFRRALERHQFAAAVERDQELGRKVFVGNLPAMFANGERVEFPYDVAALDQIIEHASAMAPPAPAR